jgi:O-antigen/teichoic acid export membrane protein
MTLDLKDWLFRNKALTDIGVYYVSTAINQAVPFLLLPVFTVYLLPGDFGFINTFSALLVLATSVFSGLSISINKHYYSRSREFNRLLIGNLFLALAMGTTLIFLLSLALENQFAIHFIPAPYFLAIPLVAFFYMALEFLKTFFRTAKRSVPYTVLTFSEVLVNVTISLVLVIGLSWHWRGRVVGMMLSTVIFGMVAMVFLVKKEKIVLSFKGDVFKEILKVGLPLIPLGLSVMIMRRSGVLFVDHFLGKDEAGLYGVALNLATLIMFLSVPVINVWTPYIYEKLSQRSGAEALNPLYRKLIVLSLGSCFFSLIFSLFSRQVLGLMTTKAFAPAERFIPWLAFGFSMWVVTALLMPLLVHFGMQKRIAWISSGSALVNLVLNYCLIERYGAIWAAVSFFFSNLLSVLVMFETVRRIGKLPLCPGFRPLLMEARGVFK